MLAIEFEQLSALGLTPALANRAAGLAAADGATLELLRVTVVHRSTVGVHDGRAERSARPLPRLARALSDEGTALAVGDWVLATCDAYGETWIEARVPPSSHIARRDGDGCVHPVVSNVDTALLVMGLDDDFNPRRLERYLALVHGDGDRAGGRPYQGGRRHADARSAGGALGAARTDAFRRASKYSR